MSQLVYHSFGTQYAAQPSTVPGASYAWYRSGSIPLSGVSRPTFVCQGYCWYEPRRVFSLWSVDNGMWVTKWDIFSGGSPTSVQWGIDYDVPVVNIDADGDLYTDRVIYRADNYNGPGWICIRRTGGGDASQPFATLNRPRNIVVGVADMTGDGKSEILVVEPESMTINWITSESGYTSFQTRTIGTQRAVIL